MGVEHAVVEDRGEDAVVEVSRVIPSPFLHEGIEPDLVFGDEGRAAGDHAVRAHAVRQQTHQVPAAKDGDVEELLGFVVLVWDAADLEGDDIFGLSSEGGGCHRGWRVRRAVLGRRA